MISVSNAYKHAMSKTLRDRAYISVGIGVVNQSAQENGTIVADKAYWSNGNVFDTSAKNIEYATLEENYFRVDGSMYFMPENNERIQLLTNGVVTDEICGIVRINFNDTYSIKGVTLDFGSAYPASFAIKTAAKTLEYVNDSDYFYTTDVLGDTNYIEIVPTAMVGGQQRFRLRSILMGVGLVYANNHTKNMSLEEYVSSISEDLPSETLKYSFFDELKQFDVDNENSFINFLETMQKITLSFGITLETGDIEWHQIATTYLKDWKSQNGIVSLTATDRLAQMEDEYTLANRIYDRTAYAEAQAIFNDAGLQPDEYFIDEYLNDVYLHNPMPKGTHKECLQILANACRCIVRQDENGIIRIVANFANVLEPEDLDIATNGVTAWSKPTNILIGSSVVYADMTTDFTNAQGTMYFLPENGNYLETSYVSEQIAKTDGTFDENPRLSIKMPASYTYFNVTVDFNGNHPEEMTIYTYHNGSLVDNVNFTGLKQSNLLIYEFKDFDEMVFEFTKGHPNNRVLVNSVAFADLSDYVLTKKDMLSYPVGYKERRVKAVRCKIFTYKLNDKNEPEEVKDEVFAAKVINANGDIKTIQNPLVSTESHAALLAEWIGNYYSNNISYDVDYRGEPRNNAADIIHMESEAMNNLQVEITKHTLSYNGAFRGKMELRRALKMAGG